MKSAAKTPALRIFGSFPAPPAVPCQTFTAPAPPGSYYAMTEIQIWPAAQAPEGRLPLRCAPGYKAVLCYRKRKEGE